METLTSPGPERYIQVVESFDRGVIMPVNMDPSKKRRKLSATQETDGESAAESQQSSKAPALPDEPTDRDREHALADAEWKNLWDATEVIDMDKW